MKAHSLGHSVSGRLPRDFDVLFSRGGGGGSFHSKGTWGCAAREGILFRTPSLAKGVLFGNFSRVKPRQGYAFGNFGQRNVKIR